MTNRTESNILERSVINQIGMPTQYVHITKTTAEIYRDYDKFCISGPSTRARDNDGPGLYQYNEVIN